MGSSKEVSDGKCYLCCFRGKVQSCRENNIEQFVIKALPNCGSPLNRSKVPTQDSRPSRDANETVAPVQKVLVQQLSGSTAVCCSVKCPFQRCKGSLSSCDQITHLGFMLSQVGFHAGQVSGRGNVAGSIVTRLHCQGWDVDPSLTVFRRNKTVTLWFHLHTGLGNNHGLLHRQSFSNINSQSTNNNAPYKQKRRSGKVPLLTSSFYRSPDYHWATGVLRLRRSAGVSFQPSRHE